MYCDIFDAFWFVSSMEFASGSGSGSEADGQDRSGLTVDQIR